MVRTKVKLPKKNNVHVLSERQRKYISFRHARDLRFTPKFWQKHYLQTWNAIWLLGKFALGIFLLAIVLIVLSLAVGVR